MIPFQAQIRSVRGRKYRAYPLERSSLTESYSYELASKLQDRLDEMGKDLTSMIEEINDASSTLSKNNKPDDPVGLYLPFHR